MTKKRSLLKRLFKQKVTTTEPTPSAVAGKKDKEEVTYILVNNGEETKEEEENLLSPRFAAETLFLLSPRTKLHDIPPLHTPPALHRRNASRFFSFPPLAVGRRNSSVESAAQLFTVLSHSPRTQPEQQPHHEIPKLILKEINNLNFNIKDHQGNSVNEGAVEQFLVLKNKELFLTVSFDETEIKKSEDAILSEMETIFDQVKNHQGNNDGVKQFILLNICDKREVSKQHPKDMRKKMLGDENKDEDDTQADYKFNLNSLYRYYCASNILQERVVLPSAEPNGFETEKTDDQSKEIAKLLFEKLPKSMQNILIKITEASLQNGDGFDPAGNAKLYYDQLLEGMKRLQPRPPVSHPTYRCGMCSLM